MKTIEIIDSEKLSMSIGCGTGANRERMRIATMIKALSREGRNIKQVALADHPETFAENQELQSVLETDGQNALPITLVDGKIKQKGIYPTNLELATWFEITKDELMLMLMKEKMANRSFCGGDCC